MICEFALPSNPEKKIRLREATVAEALDFSTVDPDCEEEAASLFLQKVQDQTMYSNPRNWTGEDRRYALFMYFVHTATEKSIPLTYTCEICGEEHTQDIPLERILNDFTPINGEAFREFPHNGHNVMVRPLTGAQLEELEVFRYDLESRQNRLEKQRDKIEPAEVRRLEGELRGKAMRLALIRIVCMVDMPWLDPEGTPESRRELVAEAIKAMPAHSFRELMVKVERAIEDMRHGLHTAFINGRTCLEIPNVRCDKFPEREGVLLHFPFRFGRAIPTL